MNPAQVSLDNNERLVRVEENLKFLASAQVKSDMKVDALTSEVRRLSDILEQAKGARWVVAGLWMGMGGGIIAILLKVLSLVGFKIGA